MESFLARARALVLDADVPEPGLPGSGTEAEGRRLLWLRLWLGTSLDTFGKEGLFMILYPLDTAVVVGRVIGAGPGGGCATLSKRVRPGGVDPKGEGMRPGFPMQLLDLAGESRAAGMVLGPLAFHVSLHRSGSQR